MRELNAMKKMMLLLLLAPSITSAGECAHQWHDVRSLRGEWEVTLEIISQTGFGVIVDDDCNGIHTKMISPSQALTYGLTVENTSDPSFSYRVAATEKTTTGLGQKACLFQISTNRHGHETVSIEKSNHATCEWQIISGGGSNFFVG